MQDRSPKSIAQIVNLKLADDADVGHLLPVNVDDDSLFDILVDGVVLQKLILVYDEAVDLTKYKLNIPKHGNKLNIFQQIENSNACLKAIKEQLHFDFVGISGQDFVKKNKISVLSVLNQLLRKPIAGVDFDGEEQKDAAPELIQKSDMMTQTDEPKVPIVDKINKSNIGVQMVDALVQTDDIQEALKMKLQETVYRSIPIEKLDDKGTIKFGTRKVFVKIVNGHLVFRVAGGYLHVDEFLKVFGQKELQKIENSKKIDDKNFLTCKISKQNSDDSKSECSTAQSMFGQSAMSSQNSFRRRKNTLCVAPGHKKTNMFNKKRNTIPINVGAGKHRRIKTAVVYSNLDSLSRSGHQ